MVMYIGIKDEEYLLSILHAFIQLAFYYNHGKRVVVISDELTELDCKNLADYTNFHMINRLTTKEYQDFTFIHSTDFGEINKTLLDMYRTGCKPDVCFIHFSKDFISKKDRILSNYYNKLFHSFISYFSDINFIITVDNDYINDCLRMP